MLRLRPRSKRSDTLVPYTALCRSKAAERWATTRPVPTPNDPLRTELFRCQALGEAGPRDPACRRAWAENRRRFLAPGSRPAGRLPDATAPSEPAPADAQPGEAR